MFVRLLWLILRLFETHRAAPASLATDAAEGSAAARTKPPGHAACTLLHLYIHQYECTVIAAGRMRSFCRMRTHDELRGEVGRAWTALRTHTNASRRHVYIYVANENESAECGREGEREETGAFIAHVKQNLSFVLYVRHLDHVFFVLAVFTNCIVDLASSCFFCATVIASICRIHNRPIFKCVL